MAGIARLKFPRDRAAAGTPTADLLMISPAKVWALDSSGGIPMKSGGKMNSFAWPVTSENPHGEPLRLLKASGHVVRDDAPGMVLIHGFGEPPEDSPWRVVVSTGYFQIASAREFGLFPGI